MIAVVVLTMMMQIVGTLPQLAVVHPYLVPTHWTAFSDLFREPVFYDGMVAGLRVFAVYVLAGLGLAITDTASGPRWSLEKN